MIVVEGEKAFTAKVDKRGHINKKLKGYEGREVYIVIIPVPKEVVKTDDTPFFQEEVHR